jgi:glycerol-3-phosphate dehydrogenase (NAD(P)+)
VRISVVGGGSWGTAFASHLAGRGHDVDLLARDGGHAAEIEATRENRQYLPGVRIADGLRVGPLAGGIAPDAGLVVLAVPSRAFGAVLGALDVPASADVLSLTKGLDPATGRRLSEVAAGLLGDGARVAVLSGPNHAEEIARGTPAATVVASQPVGLAQRLQETIATSRLRVYANADVVGVELCGAAKNVIALAAGVSDGLGFGDNAKAALITRGLAEMTRLGASFDADPRTFAGLAGLGDLVATCCSSLSRNRRAGVLLAEGVAAADVEARIGMVAEGMTTAPVLRRVAAERGLELPITERVNALLEGESPIEAVSRLMAREPISEF